VLPRGKALMKANTRKAIHTDTKCCVSVLGFMARQTLPPALLPSPPVLCAHAASRQCPDLADRM